MLHAADNIECKAENFKLLLKLLSMFNISIIYYETINNKDVPEDVVIICINFVKNIGCLLDSQKIEKFIISFVPIWCSGLLVYFGSFSQNKLSFYIQNHFSYWILNDPWYNIMIFLLLNG